MVFSLRSAVLAVAACVASVSANPMPAAEAAVVKDFGVVEQPAASHCTTTVAVLPHFTAGPVKTVWTSTETAIRIMDCGACDAVDLRYIPLGPGPVVFFTTTVTAATPSITNVLQCAGPSAAPAQATPAPSDY
ncbi:hypothetical protein HIM_00917 [Hirsutella minnesotensis 3608]|nr:hypothetical protein HIM_00917 [Hirsutella minnesotensis 3608]